MLLLELVVAQDLGSRGEMHQTGRRLGSLGEAAGCTISDEIVLKLLGSGTDQFGDLVEKRGFLDRSLRERFEGRLGSSDGRIDIGGSPMAIDAIGFGRRIDDVECVAGAGLGQAPLM